jgi:zinc D-Ala-D-Ala carboxypeptidase
MIKISPLVVLLALCSCQYPAAPNATTAVAAPDAPETAPAPTTDFLTGHFNPSTDTNFVTVGKPYSARTGMMLQKQALEAFKKMHAAALKDGITLNIISSTRTFEQQKNIWEGKWTRYADTKDPVERAKRILEYSSMPGSSRHHWGTDIDLNDLNNPAFEGKGLHANAYQWLVKHAAEYGYGQPYTEIGPERPHGYNEEKWHWSYLPLAKTYRDTYLKNIKDSDISGFKGAETAVEIKVVERYVGGVSKACQ